MPHREAKLARNRIVKQWLRIARHERKPTPLSQVDLALAMRVPLATVQHWEAPSLPNQVPARDQLRAVAEITGVELPEGWDQVVVPRGPRIRPIVEQRAAPTLADEIREIARVTALDGFSEPAIAQRNARIFAARYGVLGPKWTSLKLIAVRHHVSYETARQVVSKLRATARRRRPRAPHFDALAKRVEAEIGSTLERANRDLRKRLGPKLSLVHALRFGADILGRRLPIGFAVRRTTLIVVAK